MKVYKNLNSNINYLRNSFKDCGDIVERQLNIGENADIPIYVVYIDMLVDRKVVEDNIISPLMYRIKQLPPTKENINTNLFNALVNGGFATADLKISNTLVDVEDGIMSGDTAIFIDGFDSVVIASTKSWPNRGVGSTETEVVVQGSKEAFSEVFRFNTVLIRRRIRDTNLKLIQKKVGRRSSTDVGIMYMQDIVRPNILDDVLEKIENINIDAIFDVGYIEQFIEDDWNSLFPQAQITERPDKVASALLEGRIAIVVDNTPYVLLVPATLNVFFQASEDYYQRFQIASFVRCIRYVAGILAVILPAFYIATALYHPSMITLELIYKISASREMVPFPGVMEILIMDIAFEILREAGIRIPRSVGGTVGTVGGLIIGQSAVEAGLVSPIVLIVVALTGICSFILPSVALMRGLRLSKYFLIFTSSILGLIGFWIGILVLLIHLSTLKTFNIPYLFPFVSSEINDYEDIKDTLFRLPTFLMKRRPFFANNKQKTRMGDVKK